MSILDSIKNLIGGSEEPNEYQATDDDIIEVLYGTAAKAFTKLYGKEPNSFEAYSFKDKYIYLIGLINKQDLYLIKPDEQDPKNTYKLVLCKLNIKNPLQYFNNKDDLMNVIKPILKNKKDLKCNKYVDPEYKGK
jgi:hypothetical protein